MNPTDKQRVLKLLNLTTSTNDHEALVAMRKANAILAENKMLWDAFSNAKPLKRNVWTVAEIMLEECARWNWSKQSTDRFISKLSLQVRLGKMTFEELTELFELYKVALAEPKK